MGMKRMTMQNMRDTPAETSCTVPVNYRGSSSLWVGLHEYKGMTAQMMWNLPVESSSPVHWVGLLGHVRYANMGAMPSLASRKYMTCSLAVRRNRLDASSAQWLPGWDFGEWYIHSMQIAAVH
jgi:hypothetical protein